MCGLLSLGFRFDRAQAESSRLQGRGAAVIQSEGFDDRHFLSSRVRERRDRIEGSPGGSRGTARVGVAPGFGGSLDSLRSLGMTGGERGSLATTGMARARSGGRDGRRQVCSGKHPCLPARPFRNVRAGGAPAPQRRSMGQRFWARLLLRGAAVTGERQSQSGVRGEKRLWTISHEMNQYSTKSAVCQALWLNPV